MRRFNSSHATRSTRRFLPTLEALEARWCPSSAGISQNGTTLVIQGDGANNIITVSDNGQGGVSASITLANGSKSVSATGITAIKVNGGDGNDTISYSLSNALGQSEKLTLNMGKGSSQINLDFTAGLQNAQLAVDFDGGDGADQLTTQFGAITGSRVNLNEGLGDKGATTHVNFGGTLSNSLVTVHVHSDCGNDHVFAQVGNSSNSNLQFLVNFGKGNNTFDLEETGNLQNAVVHFDLDAGAGSNNITFNVQNVNVDTTSRLNLETEGGAGNETITLNYFGQMNGELDADEEGAPGNDTMNVTLTLAQGSTGRVWAQEHGGKGNNNLTFNVYDNSNPGGHSTLALLSATIYRGVGNNTISATPNVKVK